METEKQVGFVTHFYSQLNVAVVQVVVDCLNVGDLIHIKGATTDFTQKIESMQIDHKSVARAERRQEVGLQVKQPVHDHDMVYRVIAQTTEVSFKAR
jgi:hypothetical protein